MERVNLELFGWKVGLMPWWVAQAAILTLVMVQVCIFGVLYTIVSFLCGHTPTTLEAFIVGMIVGGIGARRQKIS